MKALDKFMTPRGEVQIYMAISAQDGDEFWRLMGRWFASKEVAEALGESMFDHDAIIWVLALVNDKVVGFSAIDLTNVATKGDALFNYAFVAEANRHTNIYSRLLKARIKLAKMDTPATRIVAICTSDSAPTLKKEGFTLTSKRGRYTRFVMEVKRS